MEPRPTNGANGAQGLHWEEQRGPRLAKLLADGYLSDLVLVAGEPPERIPAARILLAAASQPLAQQLKLEALAPGAELNLPKVSAATARAVVAYSCGVSRPFGGCSPAEARAAASALRIELPSTWATGSDTGVDAQSDEFDGDEVFEASDSPLSPAMDSSKRGSSMSGASSKRKWAATASAAASLCLSAAPLTAYLPTRLFNMEVGGYFMDDAMIKKNAVVTGEVLDWNRLWRTDYWGLDMFDPNTWTHKSFRPLTVLTFRLNYLVTGFNNAGFHIANVILHAIVTIQLLLFGHRVLRLPWMWSALLAALFATHPVHSESICYVVGRADLLCAQALLLAVQTYLPCAVPGTAANSLAQGVSQGFRLAAAVVLIVISGLCKETGLTFFGLLVIWEVLAITRPSIRRVPLGGRLGHWLRLAILLLVGGIVCFVRVWYTAGTQIARMDPMSNPVAASEDPHIRRLSYALVHGMYMKLLVWPFFLCYDYSMDAVPLVESLGDLRLLLPVATYLAFVQVCCMAVWRLRGRGGSHNRQLVAEGLALGIAIFVLSFLPMTNILFPIGTLVAERLLYIPSIGFLCAAVSFLHLQVSAGGRHSLRKRVRSAFVLGVLLLTICVWWITCYRRVLDWQNVEQITRVDGLKQLRSSRTQFNLANLYLVEQRYDEAMLAYQRSIATDPQERDSQPLYHAGQILLYRGKHQEAERYLHKAVSGYFSPLTLHEEEVWHDYGLALWHTGRAAEAVQNLQNSLITNPQFAKGYNNLACALVILGLSNQPQDESIVRQGLQAIEQALTLVPGMPLYWRNAAALLALAGDMPTARNAWERYRQLDPANAAAIEATGSMPSDCIWEFYFR